MFLEVDRSIYRSISYVAVSFFPIPFAMGIWSSAELHSILSYFLGVCSRSWPLVFVYFCGI